jgi:osmotically-inducible protein OsmY
MRRIASQLGHLTLLLSLASTPTFVTAQDQSPPDNTRQNKNPGATAENQKENKADRVTTQKIRKAILADKSLSTYAHNIKVITIQGAVELKGPVRSDEEKAAVEAKAVEIAGAGNVKNELTIASKTDNN